MRGYKEEGTTTTPFDMVMLNDLDRFRLVIDVIDRVPGLGATARPGCASRWPTRGRPPATTPASTARTRRRSAGGPGRTTRPATGSARSAASAEDTGDDNQSAGGEDATAASG